MRFNLRSTALQTPVAIIPCCEIAESGTHEGDVFVFWMSMSRYEKLLFSRSAADFRRENQSFEVLKSLNQSIRGLLKALTPYFLLRPSLKVLEFLIRTYSVQVNC